MLTEQDGFGWGVFEGRHPRFCAGRGNDDLNQRRSNMVKANKANESVHGRCAVHTPSRPVNLYDEVGYSSGVNDFPVSFC